MALPKQHLAREQQDTIVLEELRIDSCTVEAVVELEAELRRRGEPEHGKDVGKGSPGYAWRRDGIREGQKGRDNLFGRVGRGCDRQGEGADVGRGEEERA